MRGSLIEFIVNIDARKTRLGVVISQNGNPISFYSCELTPSQIYYTTTEQKLLSKSVTLKGLYTILLGHCLTVYTDHKNLTFIILQQKAC